jgi:anaphase-promoting complex subunit 8
MTLMCECLFSAVNSVRPVQDYAKSSLEVAEYQMQIPNGDLALAQNYLERVAVSNAEDVARAAELLKSVNLRIQAREFEEAEARKQKTQAASSGSTGAAMAE